MNSAQSIIMAAFGLLPTACIDVSARVEDATFRVDDICPPGCVCLCEDPATGSDTMGGPSTGSGTPLDLEGGSSSGGDDLAFDCPASIVDGMNTFCGDGLPCRDAFIEISGVGGPISFHWYGTNGTVALVLPWGSAAATRSMVAAEGGIFVIPEADPEAVGGRDPSLSAEEGFALNPFPWWITGDHDNPVEQTDRPDDFLLMDAVLSCMSGQYDPTRITTGGASAGAIMSSYLMTERDDLAGAAIWSGGIAFGDPMVPLGTVAAIVLHGGEPDQYCGPGTSTCYDFLLPSTNLAIDMVAAGNFAFLCDFGEGRTVPPFNPGDTHTDAMANEGAEFLRLANTAGHPWDTNPAIIGPDLPNTPGPWGWMLDHYCHTVGGPYADWGQ